MKLDTIACCPLRECTAPLFTAIDPGNPQQHEYVCSRCSWRGDELEVTWLTERPTRERALRFVEECSEDERGDAADAANGA